MEKNIREILKYWIVAGCAFMAFVGFIWLGDIFDSDVSAYYGYGNMLDKIMKMHILTYYIIVSIGVIVSIIFKSKKIFGCMIILKELSMMTEFCFFRKEKHYSRLKPLYLFIGGVAIIVILLWIIKKISNNIVVGVLIATILENIIMVIMNIYKAELYELSKSFLLLMILVFIHVFPVYVINDN